MSAYSGDAFPNCPFTPRFTNPSVVYVTGSGPNVFGHALLCFGDEVGYMHVDRLYDYPRMIPPGEFNRYLAASKKSEIYRYPIRDLADPAAAAAEAERLRAIKWGWGVVPHNCVAFAEQILQAGGSKWKSRTNLPALSAWSDRRQDEVFDLIDRFTTGLRVGRTNLKTVNMDEEGLARALVDEVGLNTDLAARVFERLDDQYNSDADDVAEYYVKMVEARGGPLLQALRANRTLVDRLIKVLEEGWTSSGERKCINFLKGRSETAR